MRILIVSTLFFALPYAYVAAQGPSGSVQGLAAGLLLLINDFVIPFLVSLAVLFFVYNVTRYFILESSDVEGREKARQLALWGVIAFVFIVAFWAIIAFTIGGFGFDKTLNQNCRPVPDFINPLGYVCDGGTATSPHDGRIDTRTLPPGDIEAQEPGFTDPLPDQEPAPGTGGNESEPALGEEDGAAPLDPGDNLEDDTETLATTAANRNEADSRLGSLSIDYFDTSAENLFRSHTDAIQQSGLLDINAAGNDEERLQVAYRLQQLGAMSDPLYNEYRDIINAHRTARGLPPITYQYPNIAVTNVPESIASSQAVVQDDIRNQLQNLSATGANIDVDSEMNYLFDTSISANDRLDYASNELGGAFPPPQNENEVDLYDRYIDTLQTERLLSGENIGQAL